jgi:hypothetical protein
LTVQEWLVATLIAFIGILALPSPSPHKNDDTGTTYEFVIHLQTAKTLGLIVPLTV